MIADSTLQEIRSRTDIAALIGESLPLRRAGRSLVACCPFHSERSPSFNVSASRGRFHCFGCGAAGDAIEWLVRARGLTFREAAAELANRAGIGLDDEDREAVPDRSAWKPVVVTERDDKSRDADVAPFWNQCSPCPDHPFLRARGLFGPDIPATLARFTPLDAQGWPEWWPIGRGTTWRLVARGWRPVGGAMRAVNLHGRAVLDPPIFNGRQIKTLWGKGASSAGVVFWNRVRPSEARMVLIAEGLTDWLGMACWAERRERVAVFGATSGGFEAFQRIPIPTGTPIIVATDEDEAGDGYAREVVDAYGDRVNRTLPSESMHQQVAK